MISNELSRVKCSNFSILVASCWIGDLQRSRNENVPSGPGIGVYFECVIVTETAPAKRTYKTLTDPSAPLPAALICICGRIQHE